MNPLDRAADLGRRESGLAVAITMRADGSPRASVVNAGVVDDAAAGGRVVAFVSRGGARKLVDLRLRPSVTVVFRSGWEWVAVEGTATLVGPDDNEAGRSAGEILELVRRVYAAAAGGTPDQWASLDDSMEAERHTAVLVRATRIYPSTGS
jgi:PPOX class probable F420-dependent enzyme